MDLSTKRAVAVLAVLCFLGNGAVAQTPTGGLIRSTKSGSWSAPATWEGGQVPGAAARVQIRDGHAVLYDAKSSQPIRFIHVAGTLTFARDRNTRLDVGLIKIQAGDNATEAGFDCDGHGPEMPAHGGRPALEVGTPLQPIGAEFTALIRLLAFDGVPKDSWPAIVCCGGRMDFHGAAMKRTWAPLGQTSAAGDTVVTLAEPAPGWRAGDRIIVTATKKVTSGGYRQGNSQSEERFIKAIYGAALTLDRALDYGHVGDGAFRGEVANLSRNVIVESAEPKKARGHTMYHRDSAGSISYAEFRHLGIENTLGRYALHYHLCGDTMRGSSVIGASIWDSANRWLTIHGTNYLVVRDCVGYKSIGHGFFLEDGTEINNVLDRNLAVQAVAGKAIKGQALPFDRNDGAGFWWANSLNTFTRNVACDNETYGYRFEAKKTSRFDPAAVKVLQPDGKRSAVDIRALPFIRFEDNECHSDGLYGFNLGEGVDKIGPDAQHPFVVRNMKIWGTHYAIRAQSPSVLLENLHIHQCNYGIYHPNFDRHVYRNLVISQTSSEPFSSSHADTSVQHGAVTVDGLEFDSIKTNRMLITLTHINAGGAAAAHFRNVKVVNWDGAKTRAIANLVGGKWILPPTPKGVPVYFHDYFGPNRHAKIVSARAADLLADGDAYREIPPLTGDESRAAEVQNVAFPKLLYPVDDRPPVTIITHVAPIERGQVVVRGMTSDNGAVKKVIVNDHEARATRDNFAEWEIVLDGAAALASRIVAHSTDSAGNDEKLRHTWNRSK